MAERKQTKSPKKAAKTATRRSRKPQLTRADLRKAAQRLKNWGKWGEEDEVGALNYLTAEEVFRGCTTSSPAPCSLCSG